MQIRSKLSSILPIILASFTLMLALFMQSKQAEATSGYSESESSRNSNWENGDTNYRSGSCAPGVDADFGVPASRPNWESRNHQYRSSSYYHHKEDRGNNMDDTSEATEQHLELRSNLQEHAAVILPALKAELEESPDREAAFAAVNTNSDAIAATIEEVFGTSGTEFRDLWQEHIDAYMAYTEAVRANDENGQQEASDDLAQFAEDASAWFVEQNDEYDEAQLNEMIAMHGEQTVTLIDQLAESNYDAAYTTGHEAYVHMGMLADYLATAESES